MTPIILCGGSGTRLWPLINQKLSYKFINNQNLLEKTLKRLNKFEPPLIISVEEQKEILENNLQEYKKARIFYEPFAKNTATSIALACSILKENKQKIVGVFPADHYIEKELKFHNLIAKGVKLAKKENKIVTFGISPSENSSSYGYIKNNKKLVQSNLKFLLSVEDTSLKKRAISKKNKKILYSSKKKAIKNFSFFQAKAFIEKPTKLKAKNLIKEGALWNSGIFISPVGLLIEYFETYLPDLWNKIGNIKDINLSNLTSFSLCDNPISLFFQKEYIDPPPSDLNFNFTKRDSKISYNQNENKAFNNESNKKTNNNSKKNTLKKINIQSQKTISQSVKKLKKLNYKLHSIYKTLKPISFDKGIMENIKDYLCVPLNVGWTDLGSWQKIEEWNQRFPKKLNNKAKITEKNSKNNFIFSSEEKHISLIGIKNQLIINSSKGLLITDKKQLKDINSIIKKFYKQKVKNRDKANNSYDKQKIKNIKILNKKQIQNIETMKQEETWIKKPWGSYRVLMQKKFLTYKELKVNPKSQLSYQSHKKRSEQWIIIEGSAEVIIEGKVKKLKPNNHIFINKEVRHRLKNPTNKTLLVLEIQTGQCLEEDIIRYKDDYGRV